MGLRAAYGFREFRSLNDIAGVSNLSIARASEHWYIDDSSLIAIAASNVAAYEAERGLLVRRQRTNLNPHADFSAWTASGTPTISVGADSCGVVGLDLLGDDSAAAVESFAQNISATGDGVKSVALIIKKGTSTSVMIRWRDTTASANRLLVVVTWAGDNTPIVTMTTGTNEHGTYTVLGNGCFRIQLVTTSVTALNTNTLQVFPASDTANTVTLTGNVYIGQDFTVTDEDHFTGEIPPGTTLERDDVSVATGSWYKSKGTILVRARPPHHNQSGDNACVSAFDDGTANNYIAIVRNNQLARIEIGAGGVSQVSMALTGAWADATDAWVAMRFATNNVAACINGGTVGTDTSVTIPTISTLRIGYTAAGSAFDARIAEYYYWDDLFSNTRLQEISADGPGQLFKNRGFTVGVGKLL